MGTAIVGNREFQLPILVPSISSFETPISLEGAISIQFALQEPISLISAFDFRNEQNSFKDAVRAFAKSGILLVDSGGYESQRIRRSERYYQGEASLKIGWDEAIFFETIKQIDYSYVFSYDYYHANGDYNAFRKVLFTALNKHASVSGTRVIPVIHAFEESVPGKENSKPLSNDELIRLCVDVAIHFAPDFIALPEREFGSGVAERARLAKRIVQALAKKSKTKVHLLGCGNPLSSALFAAAGVAMVDGLEWCRTYFSEPMWLSHFQHDGVLPAASGQIFNLGAKQLLSGSPNYEDKVAIHNLVALQQFGSSLSEALSGNALPQFLEKTYGKLPAELARELL